MKMLNSPITSERNSPNHIRGRKGINPDTIVIHSWTHWKCERHWELVDKFLDANSKVSCHFVVSAGEVTKCVDINNIAMDMELSTDRYVSIALDPKFTNGCWTALISLLAWLKEHYGIENVKPHTDIKKDDCPGLEIAKNKYNMMICAQMLINGLNKIAYAKPENQLLPTSLDFPGFVLESGFWDSATTRLAQFRAGQAVTGAIENQSIYWGKIFDPGGDSWHWVDPEKTQPDPLIKWIQKAIRARDNDGLIGPNFINDFYVYFGLVPRGMFMQNDPAIVQFQIALNNNQLKA